MSRAATLPVLPIAPVAFDYRALDADVAQEARAVVERYRRRQRAYVIETGRDLLAVKKSVGHGHFIRWLEAELGMTSRSAQRYMLAAEVLGAKYDTVAHLPPTTIYELSARSTPEATRVAILGRIESGETVRPETISFEIAAARDDAKQSSAVAKEEKRRASLSDEERASEDLLRSRSEKGRAARKAKLERERAVTREEYRRKEADANEGGRALVDMIGIERARDYLNRYGRSGLEKFAEIVRAEGRR